ncbi:MAG: hypothetical protein ABI743_01650, partial [bacterium]
ASNVPGDSTIGAADAYMFDFYPWKRTKNEIQKDYDAVSAGCAPSYEDQPYDLADPVRSIQWFRQLRIDVNHGSARPHPGAQPGYRPVLAWNQGFGITRELPDTRWPSDPVSGRHGQTAPEPQKTALVSDDCGKGVKNGARLPLLADFQFYGWAAFLELSEGTPVWDQSGVPDRALRDEFSKAMAELKYFEHARVSQFREDLISQITNIDFPSPARSTPSMISQTLFFLYKKPGFLPNPTWLVLLNRNPQMATVNLTFQLPASTFRLRRYDFLKPMAEVHTVTPTNGAFSTGVGGWRVKIFKKE